jgi:ABC-type multidrug transport system permease subunit
LIITTKKDQLEEEIERGSQEGVLEVVSKERVISREKRMLIPKEALNKFDDNDFLQGKTLQVYWFLLENDQAGIREIQKGLNFSSSGLVAYQINKLVNAGVIAKDKTTDKYFVNQKVHSGILSFYIKFGTYLIPRVSLYLMTFLLGFLIFIICSLIYGDAFITQLGSILFLLLLIIGSITYGYESMKINQLKPNYNIKQDDK